MIPIIDTDVLVIGGGGAGARAALTAAESGARVLLALKGSLGSSGATAHRVSTIGGFQAATGAADPEDTPQEHFNDIMRTAQGMCNERLARHLAAEAPRVLEDLIGRGIELDLGDGRPLISTGCFASRPRMYWIRGHGHSIVGALKPDIEKLGVDIRAGVIVTSLLMAEGTCCGATLLDKNGNLVAVRAKATILCTGGAARLFALSLYPAEITGDGCALAYRAGADVANLEYIQCGFGIIHPITHLLVAHLWPLLPQMRNASGEAFLARYLPNGLSLEDCAAAHETHWPFSCRGLGRFLEIAVHTEVIEGRGTEHGGVMFDFTGTASRLASLPAKSRMRWGYLREKLIPHGADPQETPLEVSIFAHTFNGGIVIDEQCQSTIEGLYAAGESAAGPHGADRLGGNMLLASQVFGRRAGQAAAERARSTKPLAIDAAAADAEEKRLARMLRPQGSARLNDLLKGLQRKMSTVTVVRDEKSLADSLEGIVETETVLATARVANPREIWQALELQNLLQVGRLTVSAARARRESRGSHYRADFPAADDAAWGRSIVSRCVDGRLEQRLVAL